MWTRLLFAVRSFTADPGPRLGSWRLSVVLMAVLALYYAFLAVWAGSSPPHVVHNIAGLIPFWLVYALLLVNTAVCLWRRIPTLKKEMGSALTMSQRRPDWEVGTRGDLGAEAVRRLLEGLGYRASWGTDGETPGGVARRRVAGRITGVKRRWAGLGTFLFHGAFLLVALGFMLSVAGRQEAKVWTAVGEEFTGDPSQYLSQSAPRSWAAGVSVPEFRVEEIRPEFWRDQLLFTELEADLELASGRTATTRINRPLWLGWSTFLRLSGFGYTPRFELRDRRGHLLDSSFVKLNVFPPGQRDYFSPPEYPHRIYVEVLPDFAVEGGDPVTRSLNLVNPAVVVQVYRGRLDLGRAVLRTGDAYRFEGLALGFPEIRYWGEFSVVRDPGMTVLFLGYLLGLTGLLLKLPGTRAEVEWRSRAEGEEGVLRGWGSPRPRSLESFESRGALEAAATGRGGQA